MRTSLRLASRLFLRPEVRYGVGPALLVAAAVVDPPAAKVPLLSAGTAMVEAGNYLADAARRRSDARQTILRLINNAVTVFEAVRRSPPSRSLRANVMLLDEESGGLRIGFATPGYGDVETGVVWHEGQGSAGEAWAKGRTVFAPEEGELPVSVADAEERSRPWNMTPDQIRATADTIASVISVPLFDGEGRVVGVLNLDDEKPLEESLLADEGVQAAVEDLALHIEDLLPRAGRDFPSEGWPEEAAAAR